MKFDDKLKLKPVLFDLTIELCKELIILQKWKVLGMKKLKLRTSLWENNEINKLMDNVSKDMVAHIIDNISPMLTNNVNDNTWWIESTKKPFSVKSAHEILKHNEEEKEWINHI